MHLRCLLMFTKIHVDCSHLCRILSSERRWTSGARMRRCGRRRGSRRRKRRGRPFTHKGAFHGKKAKFPIFFLINMKRHFLGQGFRDLRTLHRQRQWRVARGTATAADLAGPVAGPEPPGRGAWMTELPPERRPRAAPSQVRQFWNTASELTTIWACRSCPATAELVMNERHMQGWPQLLFWYCSPVGCYEVPGDTTAAEALLHGA